MKRIIIAAGVIFSLFACQSAPRMMPNNDKSAAAAITVNSVPKIAFFTVSANYVIFAKLKKGGDMTLSDLYLSNYSNDKRVYMLNAEPGIYVPVAITTATGQQTPQSAAAVRGFDLFQVKVYNNLSNQWVKEEQYHLVEDNLVLLPEQLMKDATFSVEAGKFTAAGEFSTGVVLIGDANLDVTQKTVHRVMLENKQLFNMYAGQSHESKTDQLTRDSIRQDAISAFGETPWKRLVAD